jgi:hypothetical protein
MILENKPVKNMKQGTETDKLNIGCNVMHTLEYKRDF